MGTDCSGIFGVDLNEPAQQLHFLLSTLSKTSICHVLWTVQGIHVKIYGQRGLETCGAGFRTNRHKGRTRNMGRPGNLHHHVLGLNFHSCSSLALSLTVAALCDFSRVVYLELHGKLK
jgi:hypothetical protein